MDPTTNAATRMDLEAWFREGVAQGKDYMVVVCDTFDWSDYPEYANADKVHVLVAMRSNPNGLSKVMEVYDLHADMDEQMAEHRAWHLPEEQR